MSETGTCCQERLPSKNCRSRRRRRCYRPSRWRRRRRYHRCYSHFRRAAAGTPDRRRLHPADFPCASAATQHRDILTLLPPSSCAAARSASSHPLFMAALVSRASPSAGIAAGAPKCQPFLSHGKKRFINLQAIPPARLTGECTPRCSIVGLDLVGECHARRRVAELQCEM